MKRRRDCPGHASACPAGSLERCVSNDWSIRVVVRWLTCACLVLNSLNCGAASVAAQSLQERLEQESIKQLAEDAARFGDPVRGALAFYDPRLNCAKCHEKGNRTRRLGPDLAARRAVDIEHLIRSVLHPSDEIHKDFRTVVVEMPDGRLLSGVLVLDTTDKLILDQIEQATDPLVLDKSEIEQWRFGKKSTMPEQLANLLVDRAQFLDLIAYLKAIADEGPARAESLRPAGADLTPPLPEYESHIDHAGMINDLDRAAFRRGEEIYRLNCASCHGTVDAVGSMPTSLRFAEGKFKRGADPWSLYQTLTHGFGMMNPQRWMVPQQKYDVIHYIREHFLKPHNPDQYFAVDESYLASLPAGDTRGPRPVVQQPWAEMDYGPSLNNTIEVSEDGSNIAQKGIAVRLDPGPGGVTAGRYWILYEHDTLRVAGSWTGQFIDYNGIHFNGVHGRHPRIRGDVLWQNPTGPGFGRPTDGSFQDDARIEGRDGRRYGPLPRDWAHFNGLFRFGSRTVLDYNVGATRILESPHLEFVDQRPMIVRTLNLGPRRHEIAIQVAHLPDTELTPAGDGMKDWVLIAPANASENHNDSSVGSDVSSSFDGTTWLQSDQATDWSQDFTLTARIRTRHDGTIICRTQDQPEWMPNGETLFVRNGRLVFDVGWVGAVSGETQITDGQWHEVGVTRRGSDGQITLWVDGKIDALGRLFPKAPLDKPIHRIGFTNDDFPQTSAFQGDIQAVRFYPVYWVPSGDRAAPNAQAETEWLVPNPAGAPPRTAKDNLAVHRIASGDSNPPARPGLIAGVAPAGTGRWTLSDQGDLRWIIPAGTDPLRIQVYHCPLNESDALGEPGGLAADVATAAMARESTSIPDLEKWTHGGPRNWPQNLETEWQTSVQTPPFEVDVLKRPEDNPWRDRLRLTGIDFLPHSNSAVITCWDGSVWRVDGIRNGNDGSAATAKWQRIAAGLFQPLGVKIVNDQIHVTCRDQIVRLHDLNGDGEMDWYENFNSDHQVTEHFHEFAMGLQADDEGNFYYAKSARHALPALVPHHGTLLKVSADGTATEIVANGFRAANGVCLNPDGTFFVTDQEGHWNPKNRINWVRHGGFYGNMFGYTDVTDESDEAMEPPLCWITNSFDRSPAELLWVPENAWGRLGGSLLNLSYGYGQIYVVPHERIGDLAQGGMCAFPLPRFPTGIMRGRFHDDGHLYCCGMYAWAGDQQEPGGMYRVRYMDRPSWLPIELHAYEDGVDITLSDPVDPKSVQDVRNFAVRAWDLKRTRNYGSEHYNERSWKVSEARLSADGRTIRLTIPDIAPTWGMEIVIAVTDRDGKPIRRKIHNTIHVLPKRKTTTDPR